MKKIFTILLMSAAGLTSISAQENITSNSSSRFYFSTSMESHLLSTATIKSPNSSASLAVPRYSYFFHAGMNAHYDFNSNLGVITGLGLRNVGFIEKISGSDSTVKRRIYGLTVPVIFKFGNMNNRNYFFAGGEVTMAINYKEKGFVNRGDKEKFNEWFSQRTPLFHPSITAGYQAKYGYIKFNYYLNNFLNSEFVDKNGIKPYAGYEVNIMSLTFGFNMPYNKNFYNFPSVSGLKD